MQTGYSHEAMALVKALRDKDLLKSFLRMADDLQQPAQYSNQDFDREQAFAYLITKLQDAPWNR